MGWQVDYGDVTMQGDDGEIDWWLISVGLFVREI